MKYLLTGKQMQDADRYTIEKIGIPSLVLMERAALKVVECMEQEQLDLSNVLVVCGSGNNGGDGYAVARLLHLKGYQVSICFVGNETSRSVENQLQKQIVDYYQIPIVAKNFRAQYSVIVDAMFGTGLSREITGSYAEMIDKLNSTNAYKVAIDIPSGIHDTTGEVMGTAFQANLTVAIAFLKRGIVLYPGSDYAGKTITVDIGITEETILKQEVPKEETRTYGFEKDDLRKLFPKRIPNSHKGTYGKVLLIAGSKGMSGAAYLCAKAAYAVGAGLVRIYTSEDNRLILQQLLPEAIVTTYTEYNEKELDSLLAWADVVGIGSGLGTGELSRKLVENTLKKVTCSCVIDADALNIITEHPELKHHLRENMILTPHMKEMARILNCTIKELHENRIDMLLKFVAETPSVCVMKDARTLVAEDKKDVYLNLSGTNAMAKAGAGDVLAGIIAGIAGQEKDCYNSACLGVYLHGLAGEYARDKIGNYSVLASDIIDGVGEVLKEI